MSGSMKILVIDDEPVVCRSCERFLRKEGYDTKTVLRGHDGIDLLEKDEYDVVIVDLKMPEMSGMEVLEYVKNNYPDIQVIMITGYSTIANAIESIKKGAFDYLPKPFSPQELLSVVREASIKRMQSFDRIYYCETATHQYGFDNIIGNSEKMRTVYELVEKVAQTDATVLITGESGTGKELIARALYNCSARKDSQFLTIDCSTLAQSILESELFGHVKGSFTGASAGKRGIFEIANGGTLFLDEISNIPLETQAKLLRVIEENEFRPVGSEQIKKVDIRLIAATNRDLKMMIKLGTFREDLYYRLNVFSIEVPPLRERPEDIPILAYHFLRQSCHSLGKRVKGFSKDAMEFLIKYEWPGNVRELRNTVERLVLVADSDLLSSRELPEIVDSDSVTISAIPMTNEELKRVKKNIREKAIEDIEKIFVLEALARNDWNISRASEDTGMQRTNFQALIRKYNIRPKDYLQTIQNDTGE